jgi:hypothetical protein
MRLLVRFLGFLFAAGTVVFLVGVAGVAGAIWHFSKDLPDYSQLQDYEPPVMTRVHASDGALLGEYSKERRLYLPIQAVPKLVINAFLAAEVQFGVDHDAANLSLVHHPSFEDRPVEFHCGGCALNGQERGQARRAMRDAVGGVVARCSTRGAFILAHGVDGIRPLAAAA